MNECYHKKRSNRNGLVDQMSDYEKFDELYSLSSGQTFKWSTETLITVWLYFFCVIFAELWVS
jgi:hypothetical protein